MSVFRSVHTPRTLAPLLALGSLAALSLITARPAAAQVVYDNGGPDHVSAFFSDLSTDFFLAETFTLGSPASFNTVQWFGLYSASNTPPPIDAFTISFFNTTSGVLNPTPIPGLTFTVGNAVNRTATGFTTQGRVPFTEFSYSAALPSRVLLAPGTYGISIVNDTTIDLNDNWAWSTANQTGSFLFRFSGSAWMSGAPGDLSFRLVNGSSAVPEPSTFALVGFGLLPLIGMVARRRRN